MTNGTGVAWLPLLIAFAACEPRAMQFSTQDAAAIERAALRTLFVEREGARQLIIFRGARRDAPALSMLPDNDAPSDTLALTTPDTAALALGVPVTLVTLADIEAHFREHPDGWEAWFTRYAGAGGIVELTAPRLEDARAQAAWLVVGRACGEHCRAAWRVRVVRDASGAWRTTTTTTIALPRS